ncbi:GNAT family N-acetyltransferase [Hankyongella ginsenosidimutans]|uniref:GNAT family N-acetyltransferase n=1 Tax=Hankyongella ginsenosidimutans TaxID=1763828 RepID=UPI003CCC8CEB
MHSTLSVVLLHAGCARFRSERSVCSFSSARQGFAKLLLAAACDYGQSVGAIRLSLSTAVDNDSAQSLYEGASWIRDNQFYG